MLLETARDSDPVHTIAFSFENATFLLRIRLSPTRIRWKRSPKTQLFENALQSGTFWKRYRIVFVWTHENGTFRKRWRHIIGPSFLRAIIFPNPTWRTHVFLCYRSCLGSFQALLRVSSWIYHLLVSLHRLTKRMSRLWLSFQFGFGFYCFLTF